MAVTEKLIEKVITEVAGPDVVPLVKTLKNKKNVSEFELAEKMKEEVNATRNRLYRLYDANLVSFVRKKDKKKGWYIYYWTFNAKRVSYLMSHLKKKRIEALYERLKRENHENFFTCGSNCIRLDFEQATNFGYKCPECGQLLEMEDNSKKIADIQKQIGELEKSVKKK